MFELDKTSNYLVNFSNNFGFGVVMSIVFVVLGYFALKILKPVVETALDKVNVRDRFIVNMVKRIIQLGVWAFVGVLILNSFGVPVSKIMLSLSPVFLIIGFGLKNFIGNFIKCVQLKILNPYVAGDTIEVDGKKGKVERVDFLYTYLYTENEGFTTIANSQIADRWISNFTRRENAVTGDSSTEFEQKEPETENKTDREVVVDNKTDQDSKK